MTSYIRSTPTSAGCWTRWVAEGSTDAANWGTTSTSYSSSTTEAWDHWSSTDGTTASYSSTDCIWTVWTTSPPKSIVVADIPDPFVTWAEDSYSEIRSLPLRQTRYVPAENFIIEEVCPAMRPKSVETKRAERIQLEINSIWQSILYEEMKQEKEEAEEVAMELLGDLIGDDQLKIYRETGRLLVHGQKHDWLLRKGGIIAKVEKGKLIDHCVHLQRQSSFPPTDNVISLALRIKENEREVERIANRHASPKPLEEIKKAASF